jgi:hypothetical protein
LSAQPQNQLDASKSLFTVLAGLDAADESPDANSPSNHPLRKALRDNIQAQRLASVRDLREFFRQHRQESSAATMRLYITFGVLTDGPPDFKPKMRLHELPPDVASIVELGPLLRKFASEANIDEFWQRSQPAYEQAIARYHEGVLKSVQEVTGYLRSAVERRLYGSHCQITVDLAGAPNQVHYATFLDDYFLVVTHSADPQPPRRAKPGSISNSIRSRPSTPTRSMKRRRSPNSPKPRPRWSHFKQDFLLLATKSVIKAIEARLAYGADKQRSSTRRWPRASSSPLISSSSCRSTKAGAGDEALFRADRLHRHEARTSV